MKADRPIKREIITTVHDLRRIFCAPHRVTLVVYSAPYLHRPQAMPASIKTTLSQPSTPCRTRGCKHQFDLLVDRSYRKRSREQGLMKLCRSCRSLLSYQFVTRSPVFHRSWKTLWQTYLTRLLEIPSEFPFNSDWGDSNFRLHCHCEKSLLFYLQDNDEADCARHISFLGHNYDT